MSLALFGNNAYVSQLRILTSLELFLNTDFYTNHPVFNALFKLHPQMFSSLDFTFKLSLSNEAFGSSNSCRDMVLTEALRNCEQGVWCSFLCILSLSSVIGCNIQTLYPDDTTVVKLYSVLLNQDIFPRIQSLNRNKIIITAHQYD